MTDASFVSGNKVVFKGDPEGQVFTVVRKHADQELDLETTPDSAYTFISGVPSRLLELAPAPETPPGPGSVALDKDGDLWVMGPNGMLEYFSYYGRVESSTCRVKYVFDQRLESVQENNGPLVWLVKTSPV